MLSLSLTTGYALKALTCLARYGRGNCPTRHIADIAHCAQVPRPYLAKVMNLLVCAELVSTKRGYRGGISLTREAKDISLLQIVEAVEGDQWLGECVLGLEGCDLHTNCPTHDFWTRIRREITEELRRTTLASVIAFKQSRGARVQEISQCNQRVSGACSQAVPS